MRLATYKDYGKTAPQDVRRFRKNNVEFHLKYGKPVILKQRFTEKDVELGKTIRCPYDFSETFKQSRQWDPYCFGTGFLGGFYDGMITFVTVADTAEEKMKIDRTGLLYDDKKPLLSLPWEPRIGSGDLIIIADFNLDTWEPVKLHQRYLIGTTNPVTVRGFKGFAEEYRVQQTSQMDLLQENHQFYSVPIEFDYSNLPNPPANEAGQDPTPTVVPQSSDNTTGTTGDVSIILPSES